MSSGFWEVLLEMCGQRHVCHVNVMEKGLGRSGDWKGRRVHLLQRALAAGSDVGEDVGEALGGHCGLIVGLLVVCRWVVRNSRVWIARRCTITNKESELSEGQPDDSATR